MFPFIPPEQTILDMELAIGAQVLLQFITVRCSLRWSKCRQVIKYVQSCR